MSMSFTPFNTYDYVKELVQGGFSEQQAEANMRALVKSLNFTIEHKLATKDELNAAVSKLEKDIQQVEHRLDSKIEHLDHKIDKIFLKTVVINGICTSSIITIACSVMTSILKF